MLPVHNSPMVCLPPFFLSFLLSRVFIYHIIDANPNAQRKYGIEMFEGGQYGMLWALLRLQYCAIDLLLAFRLHILFLISICRRTGRVFYHSGTHTNVKFILLSLVQ